jgi:hypothetical protein
VFDVSGAVPLVGAAPLVELLEPLPEQEIRIIRLRLLVIKAINFMIFNYFKKAIKKLYLFIVYKFINKRYIK